MELVRKSPKLVPYRNTDLVTVLHNEDVGWIVGQSSDLIGVLATVREAHLSKLLAARRTLQEECCRPAAPMN